MSDFGAANIRRGAVTIAGVVILCLELSAAAPLASGYETVLGPTPITDATKGSITGQGLATATLGGNKLTVNGTFIGLTTAATDAHLMIGSGIGIPGTPVLDLTVSAAVNGTITGSFTLSRVQLAALKGGRMYIQINSQKAAAPGGNLWGWLLPEHDKAGQDEPQLGHWFLPQGEGLKAHAPAARQS